MPKSARRSQSSIDIALEKACTCRDQALCGHDYTASVRGELRFDDVQLSKGAVATLYEAFDVLRDAKIASVRVVPRLKLAQRELQNGGRA